MAEKNDIKAIKDLIKFRNLTEDVAENIDFHTDIGFN